MMLEPETAEQWRDVVDAAEALLKLSALDTARSLGLVSVSQCRALLERGRRLGYSPSTRNVERLIASVSGSRALLAEMDRKIGN